MVKYNLPVEYSKLSFKERREVREQYIKEQKGFCSFCKEPLTGPPPEEINKKWINKKLFPYNFWNYPIHLHHNHFTDLTIGAVHNTCNAVLWQYHGE